MSPVKVLFIGGDLRSGSTLLERLLAAAGRATSVGEVSRLWDHGILENHLCGCGKPFLDCGFWRAVTAGDGCGGAMPDARRALELKRSLDRIKRLPQLTCASLRSARLEQRASAYAEMLAGLFRSISRVSGNPVVVESSKTPTHAHLLMRAPGIELYVIHVVRDSRGVAFSWRRRRSLPEVWWKEVHWPRFGSTRVAVKWMLVNLAFERMASSGIRYLRVRYEDLVVRPAECVKEIFGFAGERITSLDFLEAGGSVRLGPSHTVSGNPMRFDTGSVRMVPDMEWRTRMGVIRRAAVTLMTYPLLRRYGYIS